MSTTYKKKPFCKVCHDAGKKESEYTSHYVRSIPDCNGVTKVTCPTLLSMECRYCYKTGHTAKFCPDIKNFHTIEKYPPIKNYSQEKREQKPNPVVVEEFPSLGAKLQVKPVMTGWSSALTKNAPIDTEKEHYEIMGRSKMRQIAPINRTVKKGWVDYSDSEEEQETYIEMEYEEEW